ncbi:hypothetical protein MIND_00745500 [Mycena indigotica]|uniref:Uncharacterized protein n=1 Tax=Mycena indigotica TaxID=2126181 RepID=A0A8H6SLG8_9AGAR|nr:uncharacterized protein MIND_00745500 [Mycena indigotica]KAF7301798.1 hypothetical protein MIND_00745500 [Mycena indigotica]
MDLPSVRELELEALVRQRDKQLAVLQDEITRLRRFIATQPTPTTEAAVSLPPPMTALLMPHLTAKTSGTSSSGATALMQRTRMLQAENDELYDLLKTSETGKLKEEVRGLRRVVERLEGALRESHQAVQSLSTELDKTYESIADSRPRSPRSPRNNPSVNHSANNNAAKLPPTGPRAHKKPRISEPLPRGPSPQKPHRNNNNMDIDEKPPPPSRPRGRDRERPRNNSNNGRPGGGGGGDRRRGPMAESSSSTDRTLKERLGL